MNGVVIKQVTDKLSPENNKEVVRVSNNTETIIENNKIKQSKIKVPLLPIKGLPRVNRLSPDSRIGVIDTETYKANSSVHLLCTCACVLVSFALFVLAGIHQRSTLTAHYLRPRNG